MLPLTPTLPLMQGGAAVCGAVIVVLIMLRRLEILERTGWARLHAADMALRQQAVAERRGSKALHRRDAAVSQAAEVQVRTSVA